LEGDRKFEFHHFVLENEEICENFSFRKDNAQAWIEAVPLLNISIEGTHHPILLDLLCRQLN